MARSMRFLGMLVVLGMVAITMGGCFPAGGRIVTGSGRTTTTDYDFGGFTKVSIGSAFESEITRGDRFAVSVTVDDNIVQDLDVRVDGDTLHIGLKPMVMSLGYRNTTLRAQVTMPDVTGLDLSGATRTDIRGFSNSQPAEVDVSGASQLRGEWTTGEMRMDISGASTVELEGSTGRLDVEASGASTVRLEDFASMDTDVRSSGASNATVNAAGRLTGEASGASTVAYVGNPTSVQVDTSGASTVRQR